jgi:saccharopine dehydrogenase (NAD+, L-lysine-forming)
MKILLVGAGGVGSAFCAIAKRRNFFEQIVVADYDEGKARQAAEAVKDSRFSSTQVDAGSADAVAALVREHGITHVMNAVDPRFTMPIFNGSLAGGADEPLAAPSRQALRADRRQVGR